MKNLTTLLVLLICFSGFAQKPVSQENNVNITGIKYTLDTVEELETINWDEIKDVFENNTANEKIELSVALNMKKAKNNFKSSFKVSGETKNLDSLIYRAKKGVKSLIKISKKYKN